MSLILSNGVRFNIEGHWSTGRPVHTVWHSILNTVTSRVLGCEEGAGQIAASWVTHVLPIMFDNYEFSTVSYVDLSTADGPTGGFTLQTPAQGARVSTNESPYNGIVVRKEITDKGRGRRGGRLFLPGVEAANLDEAGVISSSSRASAAAALQAFLNEVNNYSSSNVTAMRLVVAHTPFVTETKTVTRKVAAKDGLMTSSEITGFDSAQLVSGIRRRITG